MSGAVIARGAKLVLPMHYRRRSPFGYLHGQINHQGVRHPGYDLNDGPNAWADLGQDLFAPGHSLIKFAGRSAGWGTLIVGYLAEKIEDPDTGELIWAGWRMGHPKDIFVKAGQRVRPGDVVGTCGNGGQPDMSPHLHFDLFRRDVLEEIGQDFVRKYGQKEADRVQMPWAYWDSVARKRDNFSRLYLDPQRYYPDLDALVPG